MDSANQDPRQEIRGRFDRRIRVVAVPVRCLRLAVSPDGTSLFCQAGIWPDLSPCVPCLTSFPLLIHLGIKAVMALLWGVLTVSPIVSSSPTPHIPVIDPVSISSPWTGFAGTAVVSGLDGGFSQRPGENVSAQGCLGGMMDQGPQRDLGVLQCPAWQLAGLWCLEGTLCRRTSVKPAIGQFSFASDGLWCGEEQSAGQHLCWTASGPHRKVSDGTQGVWAHTLCVPGHLFLVWVGLNGTLSQWLS